MGAITAEQVAIAELVVYIPISLVTIWVVLRHGFHKQLGWIYLFIFSGIRIAGAILEILSVHNPTNANYEEWALILQSVGLSPLILSTLGLLKRVFDEVSTHIPSESQKMMLQGISRTRGVPGLLARIYTKHATADSRRSRTVQLLHIPSLIALILAIAGGTDLTSSSASSQASGLSEMRAAIVMFLLIYLATCLLWALALRDFRNLQASQTRIVLCVAAALPFIAVRLLYSLISGFGHSKQFALLDGNQTIKLGMATVEEFVVVAMYTVLGVVTPKAVARIRGTPAGTAVGTAGATRWDVVDAEALNAPTYRAADEERGGRREHRQHRSHRR